MSRRNSFKEARNFAVYYGSGQSTKLGRYDVAIVEPAGQSQADITALQEAGTLVLAYLSVAEINRNFMEYRLLKDEDFLTINGQKVINEEYGNCLVDLRSQRWRNLLTHKAARLLSKTGYDGLFLDTIGDVEEPGWPGTVRDAQLMAAVSMVSEMRSRWPEYILVQNSGLERLVSLTAGLVDGVCWENPPASESAALWLKTVNTRLAEAKKDYGIQVLVLTENGRYGGLTGPASTIAQEHGFLFYEATLNYLQLP